MHSHHSFQQSFKIETLRITKRQGRLFDKLSVFKGHIAACIVQVKESSIILLRLFAFPGFGIQSF